jgi:hypothetical protein
MVMLYALLQVLRCLIGVRLLQSDDDGGDSAMAAAAAALNTLRRHSNVRCSFHSDAQRHIHFPAVCVLLLYVRAGSRRWPAARSSGCRGSPTISVLCACAAHCTGWRHRIGAAKCWPSGSGRCCGSSCCW